MASAKRSQRKQRHAQIVVGFDVLGPQAQRLAISGYRILVPLHGVIGVPQIVPGVGKIRAQLKRLTKCGHRFLPSRRLDEHHAEIERIMGLLWIDFDGAADRLDRLLGLAALAENHAEVMQGIRVIRVLLEDATIEFLGLGQAIGLVMPHRLVVHAFDG